MSEGHIRLERLSAHIDGELAGETDASIADHLVECAECARTVDDLRAIRKRAAALPRAIEPANDLWPAIASRMTRDDDRSRRANGAPWLAAAAAMVIMASAALGVFLAPLPAPEAPREGAFPGRSILEEIRIAERALRSAEADLTGVVERRRADLPVETIAVFESNVRLLDKAIARTRAALLEDPVNIELGRMLTAMYRKKLDLLRTAAMLPSVT